MSYTPLKILGMWMQKTAVQSDAPELDAFYGLQFVECYHAACFNKKTKAIEIWQYNNMRSTPQWEMCYTMSPPPGGHP